MVNEMDKLNEEYKKRRIEILNLDKDIRLLDSTKRQIEKDIAQSRKDLEATNDKFKKETVRLSDLQKQGKKIIEEASAKLASAAEAEKKAQELVKQKEFDLDILRRDIEINDNNKKQLAKNMAYEKSLEEKSRELTSKIKEYDDLIKQNSQVTLLKSQAEKLNKELTEAKAKNESSSEELSKLITLNKSELGRLRSEVERYKKNTANLELLQDDLKAQIENQRDGYVQVDNERKKLKEANDKTLATLETKRKILDSKEARLNSVMENIKKDKKWDEHLKEVGLL